jgi:hypothetical protein
MFKLEFVNKDVCLKLNKLNFGQFKEELFNNIQFDSVNENGDIEEIQKQYDLLKQFTTEMIKNDFKCKKEYNFSKGSNDGRLFVKHYGIQRLHHKIRGILCDGIYTDFDMINAHPSILLYLCKENNYPCYNLEYYVNNRDLCISNLMNDINGDRNDAKRLFLRSMNSERPIKKYSQGKKMFNIKDEFFKRLDEEFKQLQKLFLVKYDDYKKQLMRKGINENLQGKVLNKVLCIYENKILQESINKLEDIVSINNIVLMFDGFMVYHKNENIDINNIIDILNDNQYNIKWSEKEHNICLLDNLEFINTDDNNNILSGYFDNLHDVGQYMNNTLLKDKLKISNSMLYYADDNLLRCDEKNIKNIICRNIKNQDFWVKTPFGYNKCINNITNITDIYKWILFDVEEDNNFLNNIWDSTIHKICFKNGYYDFRKGEFIKEYNDLITPIQIERNLNMKSNKKVREEIYKKVLYPIFDVKEIGDDNFKLMEYLLYKFSRVISGHIEDKNWFKFEGLRDSGKGVFSDLLKNCFGKYIQYTNASNFVNKRGDEDAKSLSWILDFQFSRLAITQEIELEKGKFIDGNKIKKFCSGGDYFSARKNFKDEVEFKIQSSLLVCCNDIPDIKPSDALQKCISFNMPSKFVKDIESDNEYNNFSYYKADGTIKEYIKTDEVINEFIIIMIEFYNRNDTKYPQSILDKLNDLEEDEDEKKLIQLFNIDTSNEFITNKELKEIIEENEINITLKKAKTLLIGKGARVHRRGKDRGLKGVSINLDFGDDDEEE